MSLTHDDLTAISEITTQLLEPMKDDMQGMKEDMQGMKDDMQDMKDDMQGMKDDMQGMKEDMQGMKEDMQGMKDDMQGMKDDIHRLDDTVRDLSGKVTNLQLHIENDTDRNIQVLAENHLMLIDKLNQAIGTQSKELIFEVEISSLKSRVSRLEERAGNTACSA